MFFTLVSHSHAILYATFTGEWKTSSYGGKLHNQKALTNKDAIHKKNSSVFVSTRRFLCPSVTISFLRNESLVNAFQEHIIYFVESLISTAIFHCIPHNLKPKKDFFGNRDKK